jgi:hypothetical protein
MAEVADMAAAPSVVLAEWRHGRGRKPRGFEIPKILAPLAAGINHVRRPHLTQR